MVTRVGTQDVANNLVDYLQRAAHDRERILVEEQGRPLAALVSIEDLESLEASGGPADGQGDMAARRDRFRRDMTAIGAISFPSGPPVQVAERRHIHVTGGPISEDIITDRQ